MKNIRVFLSENFQFLEIKFSIYLNRRVFVMNEGTSNGVCLQNLWNQRNRRHTGIETDPV